MRHKNFLHICKGHIYSIAIADAGNGKQTQTQSIYTTKTLCHNTSECALMVRSAEYQLLTWRTQVRVQVVTFKKTDCIWEEYEGIIVDDTMRAHSLVQSFFSLPYLLQEGDSVRPAVGAQANGPARQRAAGAKRKRRSR